MKRGNWRSERVWRKTSGDDDAEYSTNKKSASPTAAAVVAVPICPRKKSVNVFK